MRENGLGDSDSYDRLLASLAIQYESNETPLIERPQEDKRAAMLDRGYDWFTHVGCNQRDARDRGLPVPSDDDARRLPKLYFNEKWQRSMPWLERLGQWFDTAWWREKVTPDRE